MKRAIFLGKFKPFHLAHETIMRSVLESGKPLLVLIRETSDAGDDYSPLDVKEMIEGAFKGEDVIVMIIPDVDKIIYGRDPAYSFEELNPPEEVRGISATKIRKSIQLKDDKWRAWVSQSVEEYLIKHHGL